MAEKNIYLNSERVPLVPSLSHAVRTGNLLFVSGQVGIALGETIAPESLTEEINNALDSLEAILESAGSSGKSIIKATCYVSQIEYVKPFNEIYNKRFSQPRPARTTVQADLIGGLRFEIDAVALVEL